MQLLTVRCRILLVLASLAALGCGEDDDPPTGPPAGGAATLTLSSASVTLAPGDSTQLTATVKSAAGDELTDATVTWTTSDSDIAAVHAGGWVVAVADGTAQVVATSGDVADTASVVVDAAAPPPADEAGVTVTPGSVAFHALSDSTQLTAEVTDSTGAVLPGATIAWTSSDNAVATITAEGWLVAQGNGSTTVVASANGRADTVAVTVAQIVATVTLTVTDDTLAEGESVQLAAALADSNDVAITGATVTWSSSANAVATVSGTGLVTGVRGRGVATITASSGGESDAAPITVLGRIVFAGDADGDYEIYTMNEDGSGITQLTHNSAADSSPMWSPDGSKIAFSSDRDGNPEVYVMNADGSGEVNVTNHVGNDYWPTWSPFSSALAFGSNRDGDWDIYTVSAGGTGLENITSSTHDEVHPAWSPDGYVIAHATDFGGDVEIGVITYDGSGGTNLTTNADTDNRPIWSADGSKVAFISDRDGQNELYVMNADGSGQTRLTMNSLDEREVSWSPDGTRLVLTRQGGLSSDLHLVNAASGIETPITPFTQIDMMAAWSPDGAQLVFVRAEAPGADPDLYLMNSDGTGVVQLTHSATVELTPSWRPWP